MIMILITLFYNSICMETPACGTMASGTITFNCTYYAVAHKCSMRQLFAIPAEKEALVSHGIV